MKTARILWYYFSGWGLIALLGAAMLGAFLAMVIVGLITKSPNLIQSAGAVGGLLGILCAVAYALHIGKN